jgi:hypothetical protein
MVMAVFWATINRYSPHRSSLVDYLDCPNDGHVYANSEGGWIPDVSVSFVGVIRDSVKFPDMAIKLIEV